MRKQVLFFLALISVACNSSKEDTAKDSECEVAEDCLLHISVWDPICENADSNILLTPSGSGMSECVEGQCVMDFELVETDCSETGQICQNDQYSIGACVDPTE